MDKKKFLVVDDIVVNRFIIKEMVRKLGHEATEAANGSVAMELILKNDYDYIFMDIEMPVMNGFETIKKIRALPEPKKNVKVIALTAYNPKLLFEEFEDTGFDHVFTKPFSIDNLLSIIQPT